MLSNRGVVGLSLGIILLGFMYNYCTLDCMLKTLSYVPFIGSRLAFESKPSSASKRVDEAPRSKEAPVVEPARRASVDAVDGRLFTAEELANYNGDKGLYLAVLGLVYDVNKGSKYYAKGESYHHFAGRDASRAFVTGDFAESGLRDDVLDLRPDELLALEKWAKVYEKDYPVIGRLIGRYYDEKGQPTDYLKEVQKATDAARSVEKTREDRKKKFPPCNSEWLQDKGGRVWCTRMSGGFERQWTGVPRQLFEQETGTTRCACVHESELDNPNLKEYPNCAKDSETCNTA